MSDTNDIRRTPCHCVGGPSFAGWEECVRCGGALPWIVDLDCDGPGEPRDAGLALRLVTVLADLQRARGVTGADATAHRLALHRERRALCAALGLSIDTGA